MIMRQAATMAKTGNCRNDTARSSYPYLFAQTLRGVTQDSQQGMAGCQIKRSIGKGQLVGIALAQFNLCG